MRFSLIPLALLVAATSFGQTVPTDDAVDNLKRYVSVCTVTGAGDQPQCTIALPETGNKRVFLDSIIVNSAQSVEVAFDRGGTVPTVTAVTTIKLNTTAASQATVYSASDSTGATSTVTVAVGTTSADFKFDMQGEAFERKVATALTVRPAANMTGTFRVTFFWGEAQ